MRVLIFLCALVGVVYSQGNCRSDPCNKACPQTNANRLLQPLDVLSPKDIQGIFTRDAQVSFYLGCVLGTGSCDGTGNAFKESLSDWAVSKQVCGRCNGCQKRKVSYIISQLRNNRTYKGRYDEILRRFGGAGR